jgi:2-dehydro-3-deoxyphosphogluconate aldolase/(4S)-4-hydroxy-2-oxoglutarate aldolase
MTKTEVTQKLLDCGVIAVIRASSAEEALKLADACSAGGIVGLELTFTVPGAEKVIAALNEKKDAKYLAGAGTVLDEATARIAIMNGAKFIVSPSFDKGVAEVCNTYQVPYVAGCLTPTEVVTAMRAGANPIKIFPGDVVGPAYIKDLHGPFPQGNFLPSGGVNLENAGEWIKKGAVAVSAGSSLTAPAKKGDYEGVTKNAAAFVKAVADARKELKK